MNVQENVNVTTKYILGKSIFPGTVVCNPLLYFNDEKLQLFYYVFYVVFGNEKMIMIIKINWCKLVINNIHATTESN